MSQDRKTNPTSDLGEEGTRIDLGDDLLERTAMLQREPTPVAPKAEGLDPHPDPPVPEEPPPLTQDQIPDQLESARILSGEGMTEDAKRLLRKIILVDPSSVAARKMLDQIHETELRQIFGDTDPGPRRPLGKRTEKVQEIRAELVMQELDRDLKLGVFEGLSLFKEPGALAELASVLDREYEGARPVDRLDIGIAFLEMEVFDIAIRQFRVAVRDLASNPDAATVDLMVSATSLLAYSLIQGGKAFEATIELQGLLRDSELMPERKLELIYLMGRAHEALSKPELARQWYEQAAEIDPGYRDLYEKLRRR